jgi:hypothetical protein
MINEITISDVIRKRRQDMEIAKHGLIDAQNLEEKVKENIKQDGTE